MARDAGPPAPGVPTGPPARARGRGRPRLRTVALVGIDGSGKTTQAHRLAMLLTDAGLPATYRQNAGGRAWFGQFARRFGISDGERLFGRRGMLVVESSLRWLAIARTWVRSLARADVAVMDRYAVDQYASIRAHRGGRGEWLARLVYRPFPAPDVTVFLAIEPRSAHRRIEARGIDSESLDYLVAADAAYRSLPEFATFVVVDADHAPDEVTTALLGALLPLLPPVHLPSTVDPAPSPPHGPDPARRGSPPTGDAAGQARP